MLRMVSIVTLWLAVVVSGCSEQTQEKLAPAAGQKGLSAAAGSAVETPDKSALKERETDLTVGANQPPADGPAASADAATSPTTPSAQPEESADSSPLLDAARQAEISTSLEQMASEAAVERRAAADALGEQGEAAIPYIVWGLREGSVSQKRGAANYLIGRVGARDEEAVKALLEALTAEDVELQRAALQAVERLPNEILQQALPALQSLAQDLRVGEVYRSRAVRAIASLGPVGAPAIPTLIALAKEGDELNLRRACYFAMTKVASASVAETFFQEQLTSDAPADLRRLAAKWLGTVARSDESLQRLTDAFRDADEAVRLEAVDALVAIGRPAVPTLIQSLNSAHVDVRRYGVLALGKMGVFAADAAAALQARLSDPDQQVRELAAAALKLVQSR